MTVTLADLGAARVITWDRQERRNAWDLPTMTAIAAEIEVAGRDTAVRMIAVRGAGGHFSAGDDLQAAIEADTAAWAETIEAFQDHGKVERTLDADFDAARKVFSDIEAAGVDIMDVTNTLEIEGVDKFKDAMQQLLDGLSTKKESMVAA